VLRATCCAGVNAALALRSLPYNERFSLLGIDRLELRRIRADLVMCYKIIYGLVDIPFDAFFKFSNNSTRGYPF